MAQLTFPDVVSKFADISNWRDIRAKAKTGESVDVKISGTVDEFVDKLCEVRPIDLSKDAQGIRQKLQRYCCMTTTWSAAKLKKVHPKWAEILGDIKGNVLGAQLRAGDYLWDKAVDAKAFNGDSLNVPSMLEFAEQFRKKGKQGPRRKGQTLDDLDNV